MRYLSLVKRLAIAAVTAAALTGSVTAAHALTFNTGDAVLVIYGNDNQGYLNLGNWESLKANGASIDVSGILSAAGVSGVNPIEYTVLGNNGGLTPMWFGNSVDISTWSTTQKNQVLPTTFNTALTNWRGQITAANDPSRTIYSKSDGLLSYSLYLDSGGTDTYNASIPSTRRGSADINNVLYLLERTGAASTLTGVTTALLNSSTGTFTVSAVPIPAAVVLFATGVIGLVGIARRKLMN